MSRNTRFLIFCLVLILAVAALPGCDTSRGMASGRSATSDQIALGKRLFLDARLSRDGRVSCSSCHRPNRAFTDGRPVSIGVDSRKGTRNAPSLLDASFMTHFFWDGREQQLETAASQPFTNPVEMGLASSQVLVQQLQADSEYAKAFAQAFPKEPDVKVQHIGAALAAFIRSVNGGRNAYDRYRSGTKTSLNADQQAGLALFAGKAGCSECHQLEGSPAPFTDHQFHHLGVGDSAIAGNVAKLIERAGTAPNLGHTVLAESDIAGLGRFVVTRKPVDLAAFRTPSLRNVTVTAPYMHDGSVATLEDAVDQEAYYRGLSKGRPLSLTVDERHQLIAFLHALTDRDSRARTTDPEP